MSYEEQKVFDETESPIAAPVDSSEVNIQPLTLGDLSGNEDENTTVKVDTSEKNSFFFLSDSKLPVATDTLPYKKVEEELEKKNLLGFGLGTPVYERDLDYADALGAYISNISVDMKKPQNIVINIPKEPESKFKFRLGYPKPNPDSKQPYFFVCDQEDNGALTIARSTYKSKPNNLELSNVVLIKENSVNNIAVVSKFDTGACNFTSTKYNCLNSRTNLTT